MFFKPKCFELIRTKEYEPGAELKQTANELLAKVDDPKLQNTEVRMLDILFSFWSLPVSGNTLFSAGY